MSWVLRFNSNGDLEFCFSCKRTSLVAQLVKKSACNAGALCSVPGLGRYLGEGKGYPLHYSGLENSMDCIVHGVTELDMTERISLSPVYLTLEEKRGGQV